MMLLRHRKCLRMGDEASTACPRNLRWDSWASSTEIWLRRRPRSLVVGCDPLGLTRARRMLGCTAGGARARARACPTIRCHGPDWAIGLEVHLGHEPSDTSTGQAPRHHEAAIGPSRGYHRRLRVVEHVSHAPLQHHVRVVRVICLVLVILVGINAPLDLGSTRHVLSQRQADAAGRSDRERVGPRTTDPAAPSSPPTPPQLRAAPSELLLTFIVLRARA